MKYTEGQNNVEKLFILQFVSGFIVVSWKPLYIDMIAIHGLIF